MNTHHYLRYLLTAISLTCACTSPFADQLYRTIGSDGKVTYSAIPPKEVVDARVLSTTGSASRSIIAQEDRINVNILPSNIRQAHQSYPVTLYTTKNCSSCEVAKAYLQERGIPFVEYTVISAYDMEIFSQKTGSNAFPALTIGSKILQGYESKNWESYLSAAGYPKINELPPSYHNPAPKPLTPPGQGVEDTVKHIDPLLVIEPTNQVSETYLENQKTYNPAGIRF